jgi:hypothetical protein
MAFREEPKKRETGRWMDGSGVVGSAVTAGAAVKEGRRRKRRRRRREFTSRIYIYIYI